jgi:hypothetical protein
MNSGSISFREGAQSPSLNCRAGVTVDIGPGSLVADVRTNPGVLVRLEATGGEGARQIGGLTLDLSRLDVRVDALRLPVNFPIDKGTLQYVGGTIALEVANPNALRVGQVIPLVRGSSVQGPDPVMEFPSLVGGRALRLVRTATELSIEVVAGGDHPCWTIDFNGDGDYGTDQDVEAFFACISGECCPTCGLADFNGDGDVCTDQDIEAFFRGLAGGPC